MCRSRRLFVHHIDWNTTDQTLENSFSEYGEIESCTIKRKPDGSSKGYAFIVYKTEEGARAALQVREKEIDVFAISLCYSL